MNFNIDNIQNLTPEALGPLNHKIYYGTLVHTPKLGELEALPRCAVLVDNNGYIKHIEKKCFDPEVLIKKFHLSREFVEIIDICSSPYKFFFPGFVDTHIHAPQFPNAGIFGNSTLLDWLETYTFPLEASLKNLQKAKKIYDRVIQQTLNNGTTTASYFATIHPEATKLLANICFDKGQRALIGRVCMDNNSPDYYRETFEELKSNTEVVFDHILKIQQKQSDYETNQGLKNTNDKLILTTLTPRFAPSVTKKSMKWLGEFREKHNLHVQTHVSENVKEIQLVSELFPECLDYTSVYDDCNLLCEKTVLAHGVHLTEDEMNLILARKSGVSHCPISNSSLTSGETKVRWLLDNKVKVGLGTDMSGGFSPSILSTARQAHLVSRHLVMKTHTDMEKLSVFDVLYLGTMGGAKCLDLDYLIGDFQVGKKWECQLIDLKCKNSQIDIFDWQLPKFLIKRNAYNRIINYNDDEVLQKYDFSDDDENNYLNPDGTFLSEDQLKFDDLVAKWLFNGDDRNTVKVYVNGRCVLNKE